MSGVSLENSFTQTQIQQLQASMESQVDVVLKLEHERLLLIKENQQQKEIIEKLKKYEKCEPLQEKQVQTSEEKGSLSKSQLLEEATLLLNKHSSRLVKETAEKEPNKNTIKSKKPAKKEKENDNSRLIAPANIEEKDLMTQEIVKLTKECHNYKFQIRSLSEKLVKAEKDNVELKKISENKSEVMEKLRKELAELSKVLNTDKFKSIKSMENDLVKALSINKALREELLAKTKENQELKEDLQGLKEIIEKIRENGENFQGNDEGDNKQQEIVENQRKTIEELEILLKNKDEQIKIKEETIKEMQIQNTGLVEETEYYKTMAKNSKSHAEKALEDMNFYRKKLLESSENA